ncbi:MAG TPA: hypothetical protein VIJ51_06240 [Solirubrobacteraceae bacterium]
MTTTATAVDVNVNVNLRIPRPFVSLSSVTSDAYPQVASLNPGGPIQRRLSA